MRGKKFSNTLKVPNKHQDPSLHNGHRKLNRSLSALPSVPERIVFNLTLVKPNDESFGFTIVGGNSSALSGIFVKSIVHNMFACRDGRLKVGDQILLLNGETFQGISHQQAVSCIRQSTSKVDLVISRMVDSSLQLDTVLRVISPFHRRMLSFNSDTSDEEPDILEYKSINPIMTECCKS